MNRYFKGLLAGTLLITAAATGQTSQARPMGFKDSWMVMGDLSSTETMLQLNYAFTASDAIGLTAERFRFEPDADKAFTHDAASVTYTRLLKRWNSTDAQANLWFTFSAGGLRGDDFSGNKTLLAPAVILDYETTRLYFSTQLKAYRAGSINHDSATLRAGFSFYEVNYEDIQPWFIVEAKRTRNFSEKTEITPMLRLIHKNIFIDAGVNNSRQAKLSFMYIF